ncbi:squalene-hopene cyclase [Methylocella silvestris BL2]|uniref:Squalene-hopene cyclase n=1 Tax=Methylocella silvestris (strain DSM 15510 / CIP 108128 / LMG 27833 / NCIMB 13906 / BL2) TaxID=395965 RepID=B8EQD7_METSB|nr:squalene--hopene cyclase [Methylocella silvestris]ACK52150.1 squalene-hopene cyclase [Methylocella silvestris BL2]
MDDRVGAATFEAQPRAGFGSVEAAISRAREALLAVQKPDGHFVFELEADVSIPAEYILFRHFLGDPAKTEIERKIGVYLRRRQTAAGGWPLFAEGVFNVSSSVKAYFALKIIGDDPNAPHMAKARNAILAHGGAAQSNVFTRSLLALYGEVPWRAVPAMPVEIMHLPRWFPFHLSKVSYWGRTVIAPLIVVHALKPRAKNPRKISVSELFVAPAETVSRWPGAPHKSFPWTTIFGAIDRVLHKTEPLLPARSHQTAIDKAVAFVTARLNGEDGLGAIYPAMAYSAMMFFALGAPLSDPRIVQIRKAIDRLLVIKDGEAYCQPCVSPVWDTALASHALMESAGQRPEARTAPAAAAVFEALDWLKPLQVLDVKGDWATQNPDVRPGGWAFQYANPHYPDLDDTAVVVLAMDRAVKTSPLIAGEEETAYVEAISRAREWILGLQSANGGFGAFDADNDRDYLNYIPFADHGALLDPPTADVTARCVSMLGQLGERPETSPALARAIDYLLSEQEEEGSWFGRWGMNYIYGTWSVLSAFNAVERPADCAATRKAAAWLKRIQNPDGGWGEDGESYALGYKGYNPAPSTASQTAWALLALMAAGEVDAPEVALGLDYLVSTQADDGFWDEARFTATGFPRVFYLRYHGYAKFFPLWAMARYRNLKSGNRLKTQFGM